jgi:exosortase
LAGGIEAKDPAIFHPIGANDARVFAAVWLSRRIDRFMNAHRATSPERQGGLIASSAVTSATAPPSLQPPIFGGWKGLGAAVLPALVAWAYWTTLVDIAERWATDPQYSHGFLVPLIAGYLLWSSRSQMESGDVRGCWWGVSLVAFGAGIRLAGHAFYLPWLDAGSLLVVLAGLAMTLGGRRALRWAAPAILFLAFMIPLPYRFQTALGGTLQRAATQASTYVLQTAGIPAVAEGNVILLSEIRVGVVEACSGLTMLVTFFALATALAILVPRSWLEKAIIIASAIPIAILANVVRIAVTGALYEANQDELAQSMFHTLAGWLMMPLGLLLLLAELAVLGRLIAPVGAAATNRVA